MIFALGHAVYTILFGAHPREQGSFANAEAAIAKADVWEEETQPQSVAGIFPPLEHCTPTALASVIQRCWEQKFSCASESRTFAETQSMSATEERQSTLFL